MITKPITTSPQVFSIFLNC